jgi:hypothetical protein
MGKSAENSSLEDLGIDGRIILKLTGFSSEWGRVSDFYRGGNKILSTIKCGVF